MFDPTTTRADIVAAIAERHGMSTAQIAKKVDKPLTTVSSALSRMIALQRISRFKTCRGYLYFPRGQSPY